MTRLLARPGADLAAARPRLEIIVGLAVSDDRDRTADPNLASEALPVEQRRRLAARQDGSALGAVEIGVEDEAPLIPGLQQHHPHVR